MEHNAAVDYAIRKNKQRETYFVMELMFSAQNVPDRSLVQKASTFAVLYIDLNSLDAHDKVEIGGITEEEFDRYEDQSNEAELNKTLDADES